MRDELISEVVQRMLPYLDNKQLVNLQNNLNQVLQRYDVELIKGGNSENDSQELVEKFISAKQIVFFYGANLWSYTKIGKVEATSIE